MGQILATLLNLMRLRSGPQELPAARGLLIVLVALYIAQGFLAGELIDETHAGPRTLVAIGVQFLAIAALLALRGLEARSLQTLTAMAGTGFLFGLLSLAVLVRIEPGSPQPGLALAYFGMFIWSLMVDGHIYHHALSIRMSGGILTAVMIFAANFFLLQIIFG